MPPDNESAPRPHAMTLRCDSKLWDDLRNEIPNPKSRASWINDLLSMGVAELKKRKTTEK